MAGLQSAQRGVNQGSTPPESTEGTKSMTPILEIQDLTIQYDDKKALEEVSFRVQAGESVAVG